MKRLLVVGLALVVAPALSPRALAQPKLCGDPPDLLIVLDHSGSMSSSAGGKSKWSHATAAVNGLVAKLTGQIRFGLMLFPKYPSGSSCDGGQVNVKVGDKTKNAIASTLSAAYPTGLTPIGVSIKNALNYLKGIDPKKKKYILLIADGYESCGGKAVDWVKAAMGNKIKTYVVGFGSGVDKNELNSLAAAGGTALSGATKYYQADNPTQLNAALQKIGSMVSCCGNGVVDPGETCDKAITSGKGKCPVKADCNDKNACTNDFVSGSQCSVTCLHTPVLAFKHNDGCCPPKANFLKDNDCPKACGNGVLEPGEQCDPKIKSGKGRCKILADCDDKNVCTVDSLSGSACNVQCKHTDVKPSLNKKDGCCPKGYSHYDDLDCPPPCGPDSTNGNCVDLCKGVKCPDGQYCYNGKCKPWPKGVDGGPGGAPGVDGGLSGPGANGAPGEQGDDFYADSGCACRAGGAVGTGPLLLPLALFALVCLRRRR